MNATACCNSGLFLTVAAHVPLFSICSSKMGSVGSEPVSFGATWYALVISSCLSGSKPWLEE